VVGKTLGHYEILELLGKGGMGEVYRAVDTNLKRNVAVKVLPPDLTGDPERLARLEREAYALASINHPNIATIHGLEQQDDVRYLVLELVEGETLEQRLRSGAVPFNEALEIGRQIAGALEAAHDNGIVHRDLKPANVMIGPRGHVKVLDFGLAKSFDRKAVTSAHTAVTDVAELTGGTDVDDSAATHLTAAGTVLGTAPYMSPEQIRADELDKRCDNWAFGCVLFEMLTGRRAFDRSSIGDTLAAVLEHEPAWDQLPADTPDSIRSLLARCLEKDRSRRVHDIADARIEIENVLRSLSGGSSPAMLRAEQREPARRSAWASGAMIFAGAAVVVAALVTFNVAGLRDRAAALLGDPAGGEATVAPTDAIDSVVILPLENLSGDPEREFFADAMTDELIARLQSIGGLKVISRTSAMSYKNAPKPLPVIGVELGVTAVVEGSVRETSDGVAIDLRLLRAATEERLWARSFERPMTEIQTLQNELALAIAGQLDIELTREEELRLSVAQSTDPQALDELFMARTLAFQRSPQSLFGAIPHYERAIDLEPRLALAYSGLADVYTRLASYMILPPEQMLSMSRAAAEQALEIDPNQVEAHIALGWANMSYEWDWGAAEPHFLSALRANPGSERAHQQYGQMLAYSGHFEEGLAELRRAMELDPLSLLSQKVLAEALALAGFLDESIEMFEAVLDQNSTDANAWLFGSFTHNGAGDFETAIIWAGNANDLVPNAPFILGTLGAAYAGAGRRAEALAIVEGLEQAATDSYVDPVLIGMVYAYLGDLDAAMMWIEEGFASRAGMMLHITPLFTMLEGNPRYEAIQTAVGVNY